MTIFRYFFAAVLAAALLTAQTGTRGSIHGTVTDASGAVVAGAKIRTVHVATAVSYETVTNEAGIYIFPSLQQGRYKLTFAAPGLGTEEAELELQTAHSASVDITLKIGTTTTEITVAGDVTPLITSDSPTLGATLERNRLEQLPMPRRWVSEMMLKVVPGMEGNLGSPRVYGMRGGALQLSIDGSQSFNSIESENGLPPAMDSMQEFRVETSNSSAKMNAPTTAIFTSKSGTNELHGSLFETNNSSFGQARAIQDGWDTPPHTVRNDFGASLGGPVYIPKLYNGKNRTFFFFAWEASRLSEGGTNNTSVPTMAMRSGDFSGMAGRDGKPITLYDPWSTNATTYARTPFPDNKIPASRANELGAYLFSITPQPTLPNVNPLVASNWYGPVRTIRPEHSENVRIDHHFTERDQVFGRFTNQRRVIGEAAGNGVPITGGAAEGFITNYKVNVYNEDSAAFSWLHTFSPTFFSEFNVNGFQEDFAFHVGDPYTNYASQMGLPNPFNKTGFPLINNPGGNGLAGNGMSFAASNPRGGLGRYFNFDQNLTKVHGRHTFQFGGRVHYERINDLPNQVQTAGNDSFGYSSTALYDPSSSANSPLLLGHTGSALANQYLGIIENYAINKVRDHYLWRSKQFAAYFQDDFKVNSRLTLNMGVRWEFSPPLTEGNNLLTGFDLKNHAVVNGLPVSGMVANGSTLQSIVDAYTALGVKYSTPSEAGLPSRFVNSNYWDFGPRAGMAYRLSNGHRPAVVRAGYSVFGFNVPTFTYEAQMRQNNPTFATLQYAPNNAAWSPDGIPQYYLRSVPAVFAGHNTSDILQVNTSSIARGRFTTAFFDPNLPTSRAHEWNLTLEKEVAANTMARVSYTGTHGSRLDQYWNLNPAISPYVWSTTTGTAPVTTGAYANTAMRVYDQTTYGDLLEYRHTGWSNDNAFTFEFQRKFAAGYQFQVFYVLQNGFSAAIGDNNDDNGIMNKTVMPASTLLPGAPTNEQALNRLENYSRDATLSKHRIQWNWLVEMPFGRGKIIGRNAHGLLEKAIGGWQVAGAGSLHSNYFTIPQNSDNNWLWGNLSEIKYYGTKYPIKDCRSDTCYDGYLWWNGYIPADQINKPNGVMGIPAGYKPYATPLNTDPNDPNYGTNKVKVPLSNGTTQLVDSPDGLYPYHNQYIPAPFTFSLDASLFKAIQLKERLSLRLNIDAFNVLNTPGMPMPMPWVNDGTVLTNSSQNTPRHVQFTARLSW